MTRDEYEQKQRELGEQAEEARKDYLDAKGVYDRICDQMRDLRVEWREQREAEQQRSINQHLREIGHPQAREEG